MLCPFYIPVCNYAELLEQWWLLTQTKRIETAKKHGHPSWLPAHKKNDTQKEGARCSLYHAYATVDSDTLYRIIFCWPLSKLLTLAVNSFCLQYFYTLFATPRKMAASTDDYKQTDNIICKILFREKAVHSSILPLSKVWCLLSLPEAHADDC